MKNRCLTLLLCLVFPGVAIGNIALQNQPAWTNWTEKEARKFLYDSPLVRTQTNQGFKGPLLASPQQDSLPGPKDFGPIAYIRLLSAKPIRQAYVRQAELEQKNSNPQFVEQKRRFAERDFDEWIVLSVTLMRYDLQRTLEPDEFRLATTAMLRAETWLQIDNGERISLLEFQPPGKDGLGAKFIFPRQVNGKPVIKPGDNYLQFSSDMSSKLQLKCNFKVSDLKYDGKLEY